MARPKFHVQHFIACLNAPWEGIPGPNTPHTLETVSFVYGVPQDTEFPVRFEELWFYCRLFLQNAAGGVREFSIETVWQDAPGGEQVVRTDRLAFVSFRPDRPVVNRAWVMRPIDFPGPGGYEFRLLLHSRDWSGPIVRRVSREFIRIEYRP